MKITAEMNIFEILDKYPDLETVLESQGLCCVGCPGSTMETVAEAAEAHDLALDDLLGRLNRALGEK